MRTVLTILFIALLPGFASAAPEWRDLGRGLGYWRIHSLPGDLPPIIAKPGALVLDLRYAQGDRDSATALGDWLKSHSSAKTPVFVLVNASTAPAVLTDLGAHEPGAGLITLGSAAPEFEPDIPLRISAATERRAYDAAEQGTPLAILLTDNSPKTRHDEASIAQDRTAGAEDADSSDTDLADPPESPPAPRPTPPPLIDQALLRAVQLHRALLALRKL